MSTYRDEFKTALARSRQIGTAPRAVAYTEGRLLDPESLKRLIACFREHSLSPYDLIGRCLQVHYEFMEPIAKIFGVDPIYTIGYVSTTDTDWFRCSDSEFIRWLKKKNIRLRPVNVHAWLTLPSMEIIDLTLTSSLAAQAGYTGAYGFAITKHADELDGMAYHPTVVGEQIIFQTGAAKYIRYDRVGARFPDHRMLPPAPPGWRKNLTFPGVGVPGAASESRRSQ